MTKKIIFLFGLVVFLTFQIAVNNITYAGKLDDFKKDVPKKKPEEQKSSDDKESFFGSCLGEFISEILNTCLMPIIKNDSHSQDREEEMPYHLRFGMDAQYISSNIYGYSIYGRVGSGAALDFEYIRYNEDLNPGIDKLDIYNINVGFELNRKDLNVFLGGGLKAFGEEDLDNGVQLAISADGRFLKDWLNFEVNGKLGYIQETAIHDYKGAIILRYDNWRFKMGYRTIFIRSNNGLGPDISGPYAGIMYDF